KKNFTKPKQMALSMQSLLILMFEHPLLGIFSPRWDKIGKYDHKKYKACRLDYTVSQMRQKITHLQSEIHQKSVTFFTHEFDTIVIHSFE
ncbi:18113_t:CDS:2, partial [Acaulospora morrowiae]